MLVWLNLVLTDQRLPPSPSGKFLRFLFCLWERLLADTSSIRRMSSGFPSPPGLLSACHPTTGSPQPCSSPVPLLLRPHTTAPATPQSSSGSPSPPLAPPQLAAPAWVLLAAVPVGAGGCAHFGIWSRLVLVSPWAENCQPGGELWFSVVSPLAGPRERAKTVRRDHLALGESPLLNSSS